MCCLICSFKTVSKGPEGRPKKVSQAMLRVLRWKWFPEGERVRTRPRTDPRRSPRRPPFPAPGPAIPGRRDGRWGCGRGGRGRGGRGAGRGPGRRGPGRAMGFRPGAAEVAQFRRDGFLVVRGLLPPARVARLRAAAEQVGARPGRGPHARVAERATEDAAGGCAAFSLGHPGRVFTLWSRTCNAPEFHDLISTS